MVQTAWMVQKNGANCTLNGAKSGANEVQFAHGFCTLMVQRMVRMNFKF